MDLLLAKAEPVGDSGSASVITNLRWRKSYWARQKLQLKRGVRIHETNNSADIKTSEEGGGGGDPVAKPQIPLQPVEKTKKFTSPSLVPVTWSAIALPQKGSKQTGHESKVKQLNSKTSAGNSF